MSQNAQRFRRAGRPRPAADTASVDLFRSGAAGNRAMARWRAINNVSLVGDPRGRIDWYGPEHQCHRLDERDSGGHAAAIRAAARYGWQWRGAVNMRGPASRCTKRRLLARYLRPGIEALGAADVLLRNGTPAKLAPSLPWNLDRHGHPLAYEPYGAVIALGPFADRWRPWYRRAGGWLAAAGQLPGLARMVQRSVSSAGQNSPYTLLDWTRIAFDATADTRADGGMSPGRLWRRAKRIQRRAQQLLGTPAHAAPPTGKGADTRGFIAGHRAVPLALAGGRCRRAAYLLAAQKRVAHGGWHPAWAPGADTGYAVAAASVCTYRVARAVLALAAAADPAGVIESALFRPEWRPGAYAWCARGMTAALFPGDDPADLWPLAA